MRNRNRGEDLERIWKRFGTTNRTTRNWKSAILAKE